MFWVVDPCVSELAGDVRKLSPSAREALRLRAVAALVAGRTRKDVAVVFQVSLKAVDNWWAKWLAGGREALVAQQCGRRVGKHQLLDAVEQQTVRQAVLEHRPCDLGLAGQLWTRAGVGDLIAKLYRVRLTEQGLASMCAAGALVPAAGQEGRRTGDQEAVRVWREEAWPAIRARAKAEGGEVLFADQVGIRSDQVNGRTWGRETGSTGRWAGRNSRTRSMIMVRPRSHPIRPAITVAGIVGVCFNSSRLAGSARSTADPFNGRWQNGGRSEAGASATGRRVGLRSWSWCRAPRG